MKENDTEIKSRAGYGRGHVRAASSPRALARVLALLALVGAGLVAMAQQEPDGGGMFSESEAYERFMGRWSRPLAAQFVTFFGARDGEDFLDIGSGTGSLAHALAEVTETGRILGIDPAEEYVRYASEGTTDPRVSFEVGDAQDLRFADGSFDRSAALLVINFIPDRQAAVREMARVTRPGGVVAACVWDYGEGMEMLRLFWDEAVALDPEAESRDERHMPLSRKGELAALWRDEGLENVRETALVVSLQFDSFDDFWTPFLERQGPAGAYVASLSEGQRDALAARLQARLAGTPSAPISLQARAWAVRGTVAER